MQIIIAITNDEDIQELKAIGADDLLNCFLPKAGIKADSVSVHHITEESRRLLLSGEEYETYKSTAVRK